MSEPLAVSATTTLASVLAVDITTRREQALRDRTSSYPRTNSILSDIGECDRQMVYAVTNWQDKKEISPELKARFEIGNVQEREVVNELRQMGYDLILQQEPVEIKNNKGEVIGRGKVDGHFKYHGIKIPVEIKSMHPQVFDNIDSLDDFKKKPYLRKYLRQMAMYLYGNNVEEGLFLLTNCLGLWKVFVVTLDFGEGEQILQRLERVHAHLKAKTLPDRIEYRDEICGKCDFAHICLPDVMRKELNVLNDEDLLANLQLREATRDAYSEYSRVDKKVKDFLKKHNVEKGVAGDFIITSRIIETKERAAVPAGTQTRYEISRIEVRPA